MKRKKSPIIKPPKMSNLDLMNIALDKLQEETGFHFKDIQYGDGYFIFQFEKNTVCHFHIKEIPGFRFALWNGDNVNLSGYGPEYKDAEFILFSQAEITIDKFKPSNCALKAPLGRCSYIIKNPDEDFDWWMYDAIKLLKFMKKHRLQAYYKSDCSEWHVYDTISNFELLCDYISVRFRKVKKSIFTHIKNKIIYYDISHKFKDTEAKVVLCDSGEYCSPRLDLNILLNKDISDEGYDKIDKLLDYLDDKYFMNVSVRCYDFTSDYKKRFFKWLKYIRKLDKDKEEDYKILWEKM